MKSGKQVRREAKSLFRGTFVNGAMDEQRVRQTVRLVAERKPRGYLGILTYLLRLVRLEVERRSARVESAVPLAPEERSKLEANLARIYGGALAVSYVEEPALVGGVRIRVGSDVYDATVRSRLEELKAGFAAA